MMKVIKMIFWACVIAGLAFVVRVTTTINGNSIDREFINTADGQSYVIDIKFDHTIADGVQNILRYDPDAVVIAETRHYENGDTLAWTTDGERIYYRYVWHIPIVGRVTWRWSTSGQQSAVPLREL